MTGIAFALGWPLGLDLSWHADLQRPVDVLGLDLGLLNSFRHRYVALKETVAARLPVVALLLDVLVVTLEEGELIVTGRAESR